MRQTSKSYQVSISFFFFAFIGIYLLLIPYRELSILVRYPTLTPPTYSLGHAAREKKQDTHMQNVYSPLLRKIYGKQTRGKGNNTTHKTKATY